MLTNDELQAIRARCEAATPGPWCPTNDWGAIFGGATGDELVCTFKHSHQNADNAMFLQHARTGIPALLAHIAAQGAELAHYKRALEWLESRELRVDDFAAPCQCEERHDTPCAFGEDPEQFCPKYNFRGTGSCWIQEALDATKEAASE